MTDSTCWFCGSQSLYYIKRGSYHPLRKDYGPFDFLRCRECRSAITANPPTEAQLAALYGSFQEGLPEFHRRITSDDPQTALYALWVRRVVELTKRAAGEEFSWIDVGAGGGELSILLAQGFPRSRGIAIDMHPRPRALAGLNRVTWLERNINEQFATGLPTADVVLAIAVWEHVLLPNRFAAELVKLVGPGGLLYLVCPHYGSMASRVMGTRWPYFTPGEHLNLPSLKGAHRCLERAWADGAREAGEAIVESRPQMLPYSIRYVLRRFGMERLGRLMPIQARIPLPAGALEAILRRPDEEARAWI